ncbi:Ldh family oxidoreductase [Actinoplanes regularis]|uniref:Uncharacterized oxidoreductase n=1 Tax=Actinoplanes regularis TaxID=52697 RepID=A0A238XHV8_9ACTN|nr:Ldh family oxidoreductase [Actinoplanes regularis]GIE86818.1 lactate dehydrogenase [Actinoplanes regularis]SNR58141.1 uncharacterized oxidoreductase [Actinoplanes regularis]
MSTSGKAQDNVLITSEEAQRLVIEYLRRHEVPAEVAARLGLQLVTAELAGRASHGIMRAFEYADAVAGGAVKAAAAPTITPVSAMASTIDGRRGFGILALDAAESELLRLTSEQPIAVVAVRNAGHMGMLAPFGQALAMHGLCCLGFVNYSGGGQKVAPPGGAEPRLATNPLLIAVPGGPEPIVVDMTTAATTEGAIRMLRDAGCRVPAGLLHDENGAPVSEAQLLYGDPPRAFIAPLGYPDAPQRGFALAVAVELLAGAVAGGGVVGTSQLGTGNSGLFLAFRPDIVGVAPKEYEQHLRALAEHLAGTRMQRGYPPVRLPGHRPRTDPDLVRLPRVVRDRLGGTARFARKAESS